MDLQHSITKAFSVAAFFGLTLAPQNGSRGAGAAAGALPAAASQARTASVSAAQPKVAPPAGPCGEGMILVEGDYCPSAEQVCLKWLDPPPYQNLRCGEYAKPAKCKVPRVHRRFCVDREEFAEPASTGSDEVMPLVNKSWGEAKALCEARGARLCKEAEWEFACEGPEMSPYPYGWKRDSEICNFDKKSLGGPMSKLKDLRAPESAYPDCLSPFGVHNMVGNVDEWVEREGMSPPNRSALRGGWWLPGRNRCRAATLAHGEDYSAKQVGFRCCKDAPAAR
ncbi:MAG: SUMF1/EgtB/PvdO family nonheme iron enzyme [Labilithrix sp.]|nr:SUMF1/EgtB/PvdO family nonheme iron enzyme [Labilithrix sp.]MCW5834706.1 SUMF1/EgtB/PvdO family nonheme iron enzyme [Labilithrix sp.]